MKLPCSVTRDLLPLYAEKMVESETEALITEHLADCQECCQKLSEIEVGAVKTVETTKPLKALKREIQKRRWFTAIIAALCVFVAVYAYFYHAGSMQSVPWKDGLVEVKGIESRPNEEVFGENAQPEDILQDPTIEVLVLRVDSRINGQRETMFKEDDGTSTLILEGWSSYRGSWSTAREYSEAVFYPIPDRLIYVGGDQQKLLWGEPLNGGMKALPRLALVYYIIIAVVTATLSGLVWLLLRNRKHSWIVRQVFFAPVSYLAAHFLIKGAHTTSFFLDRDFFSIILIALALYTLLSLTWQIWLERKKRI